MVEILNKSSCRELYAMAGQLHEKGEVAAGRKIYEALIGTSYNDMAITKLVDIYFSRDYFLNIRTILGEYQNKESKEYLYQMAYLEKMELNFKKAMDYYEQAFRYEQNLEKVLHHIVHLKKSVGELELSKNLSQALLQTKNYKDSAFDDLCGIALITNDKESVRTLLELAPSIGKRDPKDLRILSKFLESKPKRPEEEPIQCYTVQRLSDKDDKRLFEHIEKHMEGNNDSNYFLKYLDLSKFTEQLKLKMAKVNPLFIGKTNHYRFQMDSIVGIVDKTPTTAVNIIQVAGYPNIITMYPILPSNDFNQEKFLENQKVQQKRRGYLL